LNKIDFLLLGYHPSVKSENNSTIKLKKLDINKYIGGFFSYIITKKGVFFISDFSKEEIQIMNDHDFSYEIEILDVQEYYIQLLNNPLSHSGPILKNANCSGGSGLSQFTPEIPANFNLGTM
jgi:hypothetical protein